MSKRSKNFFILILTILLSAVVYAWYYPLNKGTLNISANVENYSLLIGKKIIQCPQNFCTIKLKTGIHDIKIHKGNYFSQAINIRTKRNKLDEIFVELKKIPKLNVSPVIPQGKEDMSLEKLPEEIKGLSILAPMWNENGKRLAFIDIGDNKLKIWENNDVKIITSLKNINNDFNLHWALNEKYLFGNTGLDIYFINTENASRKKQILNFNPQHITWSLESDYLLVNDKKNELYKIVFLEEKIETLQTILNLNNTVWGKEKNLVFFSYDKDENKTIIESYDPNTNKKKEILTKYAFPVEKIIVDENKTIYFYNSDLETWYILDY